MKVNIEKALKRSHKEINDLLDGLLRSMRDGRPSTRVATALRRMSLQTERHLQFEEEAFFPALKRSNNAHSVRRLEAITKDHEWMRDTLAGGLARFKAWKFDAARTLLEELQAFLGGHERDEEETYAELVLTEAEQAWIAAYLKKELERR